MPLQFHNLSPHTLYLYLFIFCTCNIYVCLCRISEENTRTRCSRCVDHLLLSSRTGFCPFELAFAIKPTGVSLLAKGDLYARDQTRAAYFLSCLRHEGESNDGGSGWSLEMGLCYSQAVNTSYQRLISD